MILLDTDVLIELARGDARAVEWVGHLGESTLPIPGMTAMELLAGSTNKDQHDRARRFVASLEVVWHDESDNRLAYELVEELRLPPGLSVTDYWIAAQAINRKATLFTFNRKHFSAIPRLDAEAPYER